MKKDFDCVDMKRKAQDRIREETRGMNREQLLEYWKRQEQAMLEQMRIARESDSTGRRSA